MTIHSVSFVLFFLDKDGLNFCDLERQAQHLGNSEGEDLCHQCPYFSTELAVGLHPQGGSFAETWIDLEAVRQSEVSQKENNKYCVLIDICGVQKNGVCVPAHSVALVMANSYATLWTIACQAPLSVRFSRQEYWSGLPFPSPCITFLDFTY